MQPISVRAVVRVMPPYSLKALNDHPINAKKGYEWKVRDGLTVTRE